jgi:hypothetical protein
MNCSAVLSTHNCVIQTFDASHRRVSWTAPDETQAEAISRKLSFAAIENPGYPNPFFVLDTDGSSRCQYLCGRRNA